MRAYPFPAQTSPARQSSNAASASPSQAVGTFPESTIFLWQTVVAAPNRKWRDRGRGILGLPACPKFLSMRQTISRPTYSRVSTQPQPIEPGPSLSSSRPKTLVAFLGRCLGVCLQEALNRCAGERGAGSNETGIQSGASMSPFRDLPGCKSTGRWGGKAPHLVTADGLSAAIRLTKILALIMT